MLFRSQTYSETSTSPAYTKQVYGDGGLHQLFGGVGLKIFKNLSVGANVSFLWGNINRNLAMVYPAYPSLSGSGTSVYPTYTETLYTSYKSYNLDLGVQYTQPIGQKHQVTVGAVFSNGHHLNNENTVQTVTTVTTVNDSVATFSIPTTFGVGFTYKYRSESVV